MNEIDRLSHLLEHWMEHNAEHAETYREWAGKAEALGNKELSDVLQRLYRETKNLNSLLEEAKGKIG